MSDYIMDLRKIVGHRPLLQVGASVIVEDEDNRILLQLRRDNHCWGYPGGSVELDEEVEKICIIFIQMAMKCQILISYSYVNIIQVRLHLKKMKLMIYNSF